jgi:glycogen synthase
MKILLCSYAYWPSVGGIETVSDCLGQGWFRRGHQVKVLTRIKSESERDWSFPVWRNLGFWDEVRKARRYDVVFSNGASLRYAMVALCARKHFVWTHTAYQVSCIDALGILDRKPSPVTPWASVWHHCKNRSWSEGLYGGFLLLIRRMVAIYYATNVEITHYMADHHPLPRQKVIYNPIFAGRFQVKDQEEAMAQLRNATATFTFLGRLVSEKGVHILLQAFALLLNAEQRNTGKMGSTLKVIGQGAEEEYLQRMAQDLGISSQVIWMGCKTEEDLA